MHRSRCHGRWAGRRWGAAVGLFASALLVLALTCASTAGAGSARTIYDNGAEPTWVRQVNGSGTSFDAATSVLADSSGVWVAGYAGNAAGNWDATLQRYSSSGTAEWAAPRRYDGAAHSVDVIVELAKGPGGTVYGVGSTVAANDRTNILVIKWSSGGRRLWARTYDGPAHGNDDGMALGVDRNGGVVVAGSSTGSHGLDYTVVKWNSAGERRWVRRYDGSAHEDDRATDIFVASNGTVYVTGGVQVAATPAPRDAARTVKYSADGTKLWGRITLGPNGLGAGAVELAARPAGGVYIAGWDLSAVTAKDAMVMRYNASGVALLLSQHPIAGDDSLADIAVSSNGPIVAVGAATIAGNVDSLQLAWSSETVGVGVFLWAGGFDDALTAVTADPFGGVYFAGFQRTAAATSQIHVRRKSMVETGSGFGSFWGPELGLDMPTAIASSGTRVYVVGVTYAVVGGANQMILAYTY